MKKFATKGAKRGIGLRKPRSNSNPQDREMMARSWCSTDPKDLPQGFTVGSMTVPYPPPYLQQQDDSFGTFPRKNKNKKNKKSKGKDKVDGPAIPDSPLTKHSSNATEKSKDVLIPVKATDEEMAAFEKRKHFADASRLQRSRSMDDGLDEIIGREVKDSEPGPNSRRKRSIEHQPGHQLTPPVYSREYSTERPRAYRWTNTKSFHGPPNARRQVSSSSAITSYSPQFSRELSREPSRTNPHKTLFKPKNVESFIEVLQSGIEVNTLDDEIGDAPIHAIVKRKKKDKLDILLALLINSNADVNLTNRRGDTALHLAVEEGDEMCVKALIVFGANINQQGCNQFTPLDLAVDNGRVPDIEQLLFDLGARSSTQLMAKFCKKVPRLYSFAENMRPPKRGERLRTNDKLSEFINRRGVKKLYHELEMNVNRRLSFSASIGGADDTFALVLQQRELALYNKTLHQSKRSVGSSSFNPEGGSRILFLDGGGMKGLVELEVLIQIEERTQCKITELFDWIVGTSTGGIIALALVYGKKSLKELRQLFFKLKNKIFTKSRYGFGYNTEALEEILREYLDPDIRMTDVSHPKVLIAAVNKETTNLELHFFNNCFGDDYTDYPVWKVARYTSAAPMFFTECDDYVDGGVLCNNPTDYGLTTMQNFYRLQGQKLPIALVVSIGTGIIPAEKLGSVDAQDFLFFGKQWLNPTRLMKRTQSLFSLLSNAISESEMVAENSKSRCEEQGIPFYRFSPHLDEVIGAGEIDNEKLFDMVLHARTETKEQGMDDLIELFHFVAEASKRISGNIEDVQEVHAIPEENSEEHNSHIDNTMYTIGEVPEIEHEFSHTDSPVPTIKISDTEQKMAASLVVPVEEEVDGKEEPSKDELYKHYKLKTHEPETEEEAQQEYTAYKLETLV